MQTAPSAIMKEPPAIELSGLTKTFGKVIANRDISFTLRQGEILSLLGENGSERPR